MSKVFAEEVRGEAVTDAQAFVPFGTVFDTTAGECNGATGTATLNRRGWMMTKIESA